MARRIPRTVTVLVDSREKEPLRFPSTIEYHHHRTKPPATILLKTKRVRMPAGDYCLEGYEDVAIVERKGSLRELANNFEGPDRKRAMAAFQKLIEATQHPYLLIEESISGLMTPTPFVSSPKSILDGWLDFVQGHGLHLIVAGSCRAAHARRDLGEFVVRLLLSHALVEKAGPIDIPGIVEGVLNGSPVV